ncbi:efflux RND transporter periplasmic adaptor subunit [Singulisphaera sp. PoT]|uniref:efflux RND transporter periplasmic adaptor subunit n=1 Tax=Singulisphaera sp. PoT TaxID=3411797 RepID=UPI003BF48EE6
MKLARGLTLTLLLMSLPPSENVSYGARPLDEARKAKVGTVEAKDVTLSQTYVCKVKSHRFVEIRAHLNGELKDIFVKEGQSIKKGDPIIRMIPIKTDATEELVKDPDVTDVKADFDGAIGPILIQKGTNVKKGEAVTTLSDNSVIWAYFNVPEARYLEYMVEKKQNKKDPEIELKLADLRKFDEPGTIGAIAAKFNSETGNIAFRADFPNPKGVVRHGQSATIVLKSILKDAIVVPQKATFENLHKRYVYRVDSKNVVHRREIEVQTEVGDLFVIKKGVVVGDKIVVDGVQLIQDGDTVKP